MVGVTTQVGSKELDSKKADFPYKERQEAGEGRQKTTGGYAVTHCALSLGDPCLMGWRVLY